MKKNVWIIKLGGQLLLRKIWIKPLMEAIKLLLDKGYQVIIVHGGGLQADNIQQKFGIPIKKMNGRRITDEETLSVVKMVFKGVINTDLVAIAVSNHIPAVGLSGVDAKLVQVAKRPVNKIKDLKTGKTEMIDWGFVGDVTNINIDLLKYLLVKKYVPVIASLGIDDKGQIYNINADSLATSVACKIGAGKLIFITDVNGISKHKNSTQIYQRLTLRKAKKMIKDKKITDGMIPKIENAEIALKNGIGSVLIVGRLEKDAQWLDALIKQSYGTVIDGGKYE